MEKQVEVMKQSLQLSETVLEGLAHIQKQLREGKQSEAVQLLDNVTVAFATVETSLRPVFNEMEATNSADIELEKVRDSLERIVSALESESYGTVQEILQFTLIPQFKQFKEMLDKLFQPYTTS